VQQLAEGVLDVQPAHSERDPEVCVAFCELVAACLERLVVAHGGQRGPARALLPRAMQALVARCEAPEASVVHECACSAMRRALGVCTGEEDVRALPAEEQRHVTDALAAAAKLLDYRYHKAWGVSLPFLGSLFIHFKQGSAGALLDPLLQKLAILHDTVLASAPQLVKPFERCVALAVEGLGIEKVLEVLPLEDKETRLVSGRRAWLLPVLAAHGKRQPCHLGYFQARVLELARRSNEVVAARQGHAKQLQQQRQRVLQLWALLPAFCARPRDVAAAFGTLAPLLATALQDPQGAYPELLTPVCLGLQALVQWVREAGEAGGAGDSASEAGAEADLATLTALSKKLLPTLFGALDGTELEDSASGVRVRTLSDTISAYTQVAPPAFVASLFKKLVQKMLEATSHQQGQGQGQEGGKPAAVNAGCSNSKAVVLCELALALVPSLDAASVALLYKVVRPLVRLQDKDVALQKRAYRVLGALCQHQVAAFLTQDTLSDLLPLLTDSLLTCHVSARQMRLRVLTAVIQALDPQDDAHWALLSGLVGEVLLCLKDANGKAREAAYAALSAMARVRCEQQEDLADFAQLVLAALAAETPHMRSAAVLALAHLIFEFAPQSPAFRASIPDLLATVLLLGADPAKEVVKAVVSFVRVCVAACPPGALEPLLPAVIQCLFASNSKVRFRAKIKIILKKLCRRFGYDAILALAPETDRKLVHHIQKQAARGERIAASQHARGVGKGVDGDGEDGEGEGHGHRQRRFERMLGDEEDSSGDEEEGEEDSDDEGGGATMDKRRQRMAAGGKRKLGREGTALVRENGGIIDLLDSAMLKNLKLKGGGSGGGGGAAGTGARMDRGSRAALGAGKRGREMVGKEDSSDDDSEGGGGDEEAMEFNAEGKLVVPDDLAGSGDDDEAAAGAGRGMGFNLMDLGEDAIESDEEDVGRTKRQKRADGSFGPCGGGGGGGRGGQQRGGKGGKGGKGATGVAPGATYKSKKAGGDVKRKGQLEPYAYVPLNPKMLSKRNKGEAAMTFDAVVGNKKARREERQQQRSKAQSRRGSRR
jgi:ribosomal RNA-processing protein 12